MTIRDMIGVGSAETAGLFDQPLSRRSCLAIAMGASLAAPAAAQGTSRSSPRLEEATRRLRAFVERERAVRNIPGLVVAAVGRDGARIEVADGFADRDRGVPLTSRHLMQIGSITKSFAAVAAFRLKERGKLDLDAPIATYLTGLPLPDGPPISVRHLLSHTAGLSDGSPILPRGEKSLWVGFTPGSRFSYSNTGYLLLGLVLERCSGQTFDRLIRELVFEPLRMSASTAEITSLERARYAIGYAPQSPDLLASNNAPLVVAPWVDFIGGAGSIASTADDMVQYLAWLLDATTKPRTAPISLASARELLSPVISTPDYGASTNYAHGLFVEEGNGGLVAHHTGGMIAFSSALRAEIGRGVGAFASVNFARSGYRPKAVVDYACALMAAARDGGPWPAEPAIKPPAEVANAADYAGQYVSASGRHLRLSARQNRLVLTSGAKTIEVEPTSRPDLFVVPDRDFALYPLGFTRADGKVSYAYHGSEIFRPAGAGASGAPDPGLAPYVGSYLCENPWRGTIRIVSRPDGLWLNGHRKLVSLGDGLFREGPDEWSTERVRFDGLVAGRAMRMVRSGVDYLRVSSAF